MSDPLTEEIPHQHLIAELQTQLNTRTSELVVANARIRTRDHTIELLRQQLNAANDQIHDLENRA